MASSAAAPTAGQGAGALGDLREQLLALANTESELRLELKAARAQIAQLAQNEAMARSLLKESHSVTRALHERARLETDAATAELRESLEAERAKSQSELARATDALRTHRNRPDAEMETLRALFADLMRGEALGRQRLERLQQQLDLERDARRKAEAQLLPAAAPPIPADPAAGTVPASDEQELLGQLKTAAAELEKKHAALGRELAEERGKARAQAEGAVAEVEWARDRAKAAAESEQEAKAALFEVRKQVAQAQEKHREDADERERAAAQFADQLAGLRKKSEDERARANAEIARRVQAVETLQEAVSGASAAAETAAASLAEERAVAAGLRDEAARLGSARDTAQEAARDLSLREQRSAVELAEIQARATQLESQLDELRPALAARTEGELAARAAAAQAEKARDEVQVALAGLEATLAGLRAASAQQAETLQGAVSAASAAAEKAAARLAEEKAVAAGLRDEVARLGSARDTAQEAARDLSLRERRSAVELAEIRARATQLESQLDELRPALAARTEGESTARAAAAQAENARDEVQRALAGLEATLAGLRATSAQQALTARNELAEAKAEQARLSAEAERLRTSEDERGRTAEALAGELGQARGDAERLQGALDRTGVALAALQALHSRLEADLVEARQQRDEEARSRVEQGALLRDERSQLAAALQVETTRAEQALRESQGLGARCDLSERELAEAAQRTRAAEADAAQAKAAQERLSAIASARREALIAELGGRFADAEALLQAELGQSPIEAPLLLQLGRLHYAWAEGAPGSHEEIAERLLARATELDLYDATAPLYLGHVRLRRGLHRAAQEAYRETIDRDSQCAPAHEALAVLSVRSMKRQARFALAAALALLLCSAAIFIHRLVQGTGEPAASAFPESQEPRAKSEVVHGRRSAER